MTKIKTSRSSISSSNDDDEEEEEENYSTTTTSTCFVFSSSGKRIHVITDGTDGSTNTNNGATSTTSRLKLFFMLLTVVGIPLFMIYWQTSSDGFTNNDFLIVGGGGGGRSKRPSSSSSTAEEEEFIMINDNDNDDSIVNTTKNKKKNKKENLNPLTDVVQTTTTTTVTSSNDNKKKTKKTSNTTSTTDNTDSKNRPSMIWLMSFPNSGTSYTMRMVSSASNRAIATNYGPEVIYPPHTSVPLYDNDNNNNDHVEGPFWRGNVDDTEHYKPLPDKYILTKTHCGGRCVRCSPKKYMLTLSQFIHACTEGTACVRPPQVTTSTSNNTNTTTIQKQHEEKCEWIETHYPPPPNNPHIGKLIHLIRDPFTNIISRFHLARKLWTKRLKDDPVAQQQWLQDHPDNGYGFSKWCNETDHNYGSPFDTIRKNNKFTTTTLNCKGEWFRYVQWHSLALATIQKTKLPFLTVYYEDYGYDWNTTVHKILDFVEIPSSSSDRNDENSILEFLSRPPYDNYYTQEQRQEAYRLVKELATPDVWKYIKHYFA